MLRAHNADGKWIDGVNAMRGTSYYCPRCRERLTVVKDSSKMIDHFRHRAESTCSFGADESPEHAGKKFTLFDGLRSAIGEDNVRMEYTLDDGQRPDVYFEVAGQGVAVEVQHSPISDKELADRTASYSTKSVAALWLPDNIKAFLNTVEIADATGLTRMPLWMRRIAQLTDNVAFDMAGGGSDLTTELISVALKLEERTIKNAQGVWVVDRYWPIQKCVLHKGVVRSDVDDYGYPRMLWLPNPISGKGLVSTRPVRMQMRREVVETHGSYVDCNREPIPIIASDSGSEFHETLRKYWRGVGSFLSQEKRMQMWGYK
jgi:hypothetical protein